jgi:hypothetical protein
VVHGEGVELGVIELRAGKPPKLIPSSQSEAVTKLQARLKAVGGPEGIGLDMHLPPPSGKGRGPYGTVIVKWDNPLYRHALEQELEPDYSVKEVPELRDAPPPAKFTTLQVSRSGKEAGSVDFSKTLPRLISSTDSGDGLGLKHDVEYLQQKDEVMVRYVHRPTGGAAQLVTRRSKPGADDYAQTAVLHLMAERYYTTRYAYELKFDGSPSAGGAPDCKNLRKTVVDEAAKLATCKTDADCTVHRIVLCDVAELDCHTAHVNKGGDTKALDAAVGAYAKSCPQAKCKCAVPEKSICSSGKCAAG